MKEGNIMEEGRSIPAQPVGPVPVASQGTPGTATRVVHCHNCHSAYTVGQFEDISRYNCTRCNYSLAGAPTTGYTYYSYNEPRTQKESGFWSFLLFRSMV